jgi:hypothetical protein
MSYKHGLGGLFAVLLGLLSINAARANEIFVANAGNGTIGEYTTAGAPVNPGLITGLNSPSGIAVSGSDLFVTNSAGAASTIGEYTTAGATVNPALISGLTDPAGIAVLSTVPEPSSLTLTLLGLVAGGLVFRRGRCKRAS